MSSQPHHVPFAMPKMPPSQSAPKPIRVSSRSDPKRSSLGLMYMHPPKILKSHQQAAIRVPRNDGGCIWPQSMEIVAGGKITTLVHDAWIHHSVASERGGSRRDTLSLRGRSSRARAAADAVELADHVRAVAVRAPHSTAIAVGVVADPREVAQGAEALHLRFYVQFPSRNVSRATGPCSLPLLAGVNHQKDAASRRPSWPDLELAGQPVVRCVLDLSQSSVCNVYSRFTRVKPVPPRVA